MYHTIIDILVSFNFQKKNVSVYDNFITICVVTFACKISQPYIGSYVSRAHNLIDNACCDLGTWGGRLSQN